MSNGTLASTPTRTTRPADLEPQSLALRLVVGLFIAVPTAALLAAVVIAWGWGMTLTDILLAVAFYLVTACGITVGYHRLFTHRSFTAVRPLRVALAVAGALALEGSVIRWVSDHRRHHQFSDQDGDPHSPWRYGTSARAVAKGLAYAHLGWMFDTWRPSARRYAPDLRADPDLVRISRLFPAWVVASLGLPALIGGLVTLSWHGALTAFVWAGLVRVGLLHHVTWSVNSICHVFGARQFTSRDRSTNVWWLAPLSLGESWHNLHHALPTSARHGVLRGQLDPSARLIWLFERLRLARDVRWPDPARVASLAVSR